MLTYEPGELAEPPGDVDRKHGAVALLQSQVGEVVREAAELLGDAGVAEVQHDVEAQRLKGGQVTLPGEVVELDAGWVLLVLRQAQHLQVVVTHKVLGLHLRAAHRKVLGTYGTEIKRQTTSQHSINRDVISNSSYL